MTVGLVVEIIGDASKLAGSLSSAEGDVKGFGSSLAGSAVKIAAVAGVAGVAAGAIAEMTSAAAEDQAEQARLEQAVVAAGAATGDYKAQLDAAIASSQAKAFTDTQAREAMQSLVTATGSVTEASALMTSAQDIARFANVDLATAADAVAKANAGQDGALRKLMPGLAKGATATDTLALATKQAAGQADTYAESAEGMREKGGNAFSELTETIGSAFLPVLDALLPAIIPIIEQFGELVSAILPIVTPLLKAMLVPLRLLGEVLKVVVGWLTKLVRWLGDAARKVGEFLDSINPLSGISLPSLPFLSAAPAAGGFGGLGRAGFAAPAPLAIPSGGIVINISGDPAIIEATVVRALRKYGRANAFGSPVVTTSAL